MHGSMHVYLDGRVTNFRRNVDQHMLFTSTLNSIGNRPRLAKFYHGRQSSCSKKVEPRAGNREGTGEFNRYFLT